MNDRDWADDTFAPLDDGGKNRTAVGVGVVILGLVGLVMAMQTTSLMNGTGTIWLGVVVVAASLAASFFLGASTGVKVTASILLALALIGALYMEHQMSEKRAEITSQLDSYRS